MVEGEGRRGRKGSAVTAAEGASSEGAPPRHVVGVYGGRAPSRAPGQLHRPRPLRGWRSGRSCGRRRGPANGTSSEPVRQTTRVGRPGDHRRPTSVKSGSQTSASLLSRSKLPPAGDVTAPCPVAGRHGAQFMAVHFGRGRPGSSSLKRARASRFSLSPSNFIKLASCSRELRR